MGPQDHYQPNLCIDNDMAMSQTLYLVVVPNKGDIIIRICPYSSSFLDVISILHLFAEAYFIQNTCTGYWDLCKNHFNLLTYINVKAYLGSVCNINILYWFTKGGFENTISILKKYTLVTYNLLIDLHQMKIKLALCLFIELLVTETLYSCHIYSLWEGTKISQCDLYLT